MIISDKGYTRYDGTVPQILADLQMIFNTLKREKIINKELINLMFDMAKGEDPEVEVDLKELRRQIYGNADGT